MKLTLVLFDGFTALDVVGGYEVLARLPGVELELTGPQRGIVSADTRRLGLTSVRALDEVASTDILYVPGGPGALALEHDSTFLARLKALDATSSWTVGICNGVGLLAAAGMLTAKAATTNFFYRDRLRAYGVEVLPKRFHRDGKYVTGAGVSASIDTALFLVSLIAGETAMKALALGIEYFPAPPYPERTPEEIPAEIAELVRAAEEEQRAAL